MSHIPRLYLRSPLAQGAVVALEEAQAHHLRHVMRLRDGEEVRVFNGGDGEWQATAQLVGKRDVQLDVSKQLRQQRTGPDVWLVFAPIKHGKIDFLVQKATELGASCFLPVMTQHTAMTRVNTERLQANAVEAAEQSGRLDVPPVREPVTLAQLLSAWPQERRLLYGDESGDSRTAAEVLAPLKSQPLALLIGPEGGFSLQEHAQLRTLPFASGFTMGPRVMRADTAALAALAVTQALAGDWHEKPDFIAT